MYKKTHIHSLLSSLAIFSAKEKQEILSQYANATTGSIDGLVAILEGAKEKQDTYIAAMVKADPSFAKRTTQFLHDKVQSMQSDSKKDDDSHLQQMEEEFT